MSQLVATLPSRRLATPPPRDGYFAPHACRFKLRAADARILTALLWVHIIFAAPDRSCVQSECFFVVLRREIARFNFTSSYLVFELYAAQGCLHTAFLCSLNRFKSTTRRADGYCPPFFLLALQSRLIKRPFGFLISPSRYRPTTVLKQALLHCF